MPKAVCLLSSVSYSSQVVNKELLLSFLKIEVALLEWEKEIWLPECLKVNMEKLRFVIDQRS